MSNPASDNREAFAEQILAGATRAFGQHGFQGASMRKIAGELGVSAPTLYYYFPSKQELVWAILERGLEDFEEFCGAALDTSQDPVEQIRAHVVAHVHYNYANRDFIQMMDLFFTAVSQAPTDIYDGVATMARNVLTPEKAEVFSSAVEKLLREIAEVIRQGVDQGLFQVQHLELATAAVIILPDRVIRWIQPSPLFGVDDIAVEQSRLILRMLGAQDA